MKLKELTVTILQSFIDFSFALEYKVLEERQKLINNTFVKKILSKKLSFQLH
jgi:hypothetical protein